MHERCGNDPTAANGDNDDDKVKHVNAEPERYIRGGLALFQKFSSCAKKVTDRIYYYCSSLMAYLLSRAFLALKLEHR